jgi:hypothetical protein
MLVLELRDDFHSAGGERIQMRRGDELPITGYQGELMGERAMVFSGGGIFFMEGSV